MRNTQYGSALFSGECPKCKSQVKPADSLSVNEFMRDAINEIKNTAAAVCKKCGPVRVRFIKFLLILLLPIILSLSCEELKRAASENPEATTAIETAAESGVGILEALSVLWPGAAAGAAGLGVALKAWRNAKGKLSESQTNSEQYYHATESLVAAIGEYKTANPEKWAEMKENLESAIGPEAENVIRAVRGLPAKT